MTLYGYAGAVGDNFARFREGWLGNADGFLENVVDNFKPTARLYDAFEDNRTFFRERESWKYPIFDGRAVRKTPNAS
jgi:hypothetical protein